MRRPPQSNYPPDIVLRQDNCRKLAIRIWKGGISRSAPPRLAPRLHSLPPILHIHIPIAVSSCSKGPRGLSVLPRVGGIFTSTTISLDLWPRQLPSRYAIHAGRYLTDKEFRYLRTVIVTAAVYRGFGSWLRPYGLTNPLNLPAPGRRHTLYILLRVSRVLCFW